jgi:5-formyltetrahydrofolate cyclo-ligase
MTKASIRKSYLAQRQALTTEAMHEMLTPMLHQFLSLSLPSPAMYMSYRSMDNRHEVPVHYFESVLSDEVAGIQFCYPRIQMADGSMDAIADDDAVQWEETVFGLEEPVEGNIVSPEKIDVVLVPLLAFDIRGFRVGYGKGFYDRFLTRCKKDVLTIGLSWFPPVESIDDIHANDVPLKYCITPQRIYAF